MIKCIGEAVALKPVSVNVQDQGALDPHLEEINRNENEAPLREQEKAERAGGPGGDPRKETAPQEE